MTPCRLVDGYRAFKETCCLKIQTWLWMYQLDVHGSVHRKRIFKYNQQAATLY